MYCEKIFFAFFSNQKKLTALCLSLICVLVAINTAFWCDVWNSTGLKYALGDFVYINTISPFLFIGVMPVSLFLFDTLVLSNILSIQLIRFKTRKKYWLFLSFSAIIIGIVTSVIVVGISLLTGVCINPQNRQLVNWGEQYSIYWSEVRHISDKPVYFTKFVGTQLFAVIFSTVILIGLFCCIKFMFSSKVASTYCPWIICALVCWTIAFPISFRGVSITNELFLSYKKWDTNSIGGFF